jgi:hypothetical protein
MLSAQTNIGPNEHRPFELPIELSLKIFSSLSYEDMLTLTFIAKQFNLPSLWKSIFQYFYPGPYQELSVKPNIFYKKEYLQHANDKINFPHLCMSATQKQRDQMTIKQKTAIERLLLFLSESQKKIASTHNPIYSNSFHRILFFRNNVIFEEIEIANTFKDFILFGDKNPDIEDAINQIRMNSILSTIYLNLVEAELLPQNNREAKEATKDMTLA